jgi:hypothetical protein
MNLGSSARRRLLLFRPVLQASLRKDLAQEQLHNVPDRCAARTSASEHVGAGDRQAAARRPPAMQPVALRSGVPLIGFRRRGCRPATDPDRRSVSVRSGGRHFRQGTWQSGRHSLPMSWRGPLESALSHHSGSRPSRAGGYLRASSVKPNNGGAFFGLPWRNLVQPWL